MVRLKIECSIENLSCYISVQIIKLKQCPLGKYSKMKRSKFCGYRHKEGGSERGEKDTNGILISVFFQKTYRIILGPPKHVLHLVWSVLGISTAIKTALKVALFDFFDGPFE